LYEKRGFNKISVDGKKVFYEFNLNKQKIPDYHTWLKVNIVLEHKVEA